MNVITKTKTFTRWLTIMLATALLSAALLPFTAIQAAGDTMLQLSFTDLPQLGDGYVYEGWLIVDGTPVSTGVFMATADGDATQTLFDGDADATDFVLTIEPEMDSDPAPSDVHLLGGTIVDGSAVLSIDHPAALNTDFADATGQFILAAPTAADGEGATYLNGVWFLDPTAGPGPSLDLPTLPAGWMYEGWVAGPDGPVSTGTFTMTTGADSDGGGAKAGSNAAPPFPGQDFVNPLTDLTGYRAVISVEPYPDDSAAPFILKPLVSEPATDPGMGGVLQAMGNNSSVAPAGTADLITVEAPIPTTNYALDLDFTDLPDVGPDFVYEGWLMVNGAPVSTGVFTVDADGNASQSMFAISGGDATAFILTIEPAVGDDPAPSAVHVLAGDIVDGMTDLSIAHPAAIGTDFADAAGQFILAAPTAADDEGATYLNGIWFLDPTAGPGASLDLPVLPAGWVYEGWVVVDGTPISTGTFTDTMMADSDGGGATAGSNAAPPFPGQDFVTPLTDLTGATVVISVEPDPDTSAAPFILKPLVGTAADLGEPGILQDLGNNSSVAPTGTAAIMSMDTVVLNYSNCNVPELGANSVYEGWVIESGMVHPAGRFTVDADGNLSDSVFAVTVNDSDDLRVFVLTIEPAEGDDPAPSSTHLVGGDFMDGTVNATIDHSSALGTDFASAMGGYILGVPSATDADGASYNNGIWFLDPAAGPGAGLDLPMLPNGWVYEGWVVVDGTPISTGTFTDVMMADSDGGGATAGTNGTPPFPGQDFVTNLLDLVGGTAVISVEPAPDDSPMPFAIKPLVDGTIDDTGGPGIVQTMANNATDLPTCTVSVMSPTSVTMGSSVMSASANSALLIWASVLLVGTAVITTRRTN